VTVSGANVTGKNFTAVVATYLISGMVTSSGVGLSGVTMTVPGAGSGTATTDSSGNYTLSGAANGTYIVRPSLSGYTFSPAGISVTVSGSNMTGNNFSATAVIPPGSGTWTLVKLPDTGQTTCYDSAGTVIACSGTRQDGAYTLNPPSYTDNGNGTITDNVTGLVWQKQDDGTTRTGDAADTYCSGNAAGLPGTGWRLPTDFELVTIVDYGRSAPAINPVFTGTQSSSYWSSTTNVDNSTYVWHVSFFSGDVNCDTMANLYSVRCVH
jgi:hypothetical protein